MGILSRMFGNKPEDVNQSARMGWRYITYIQNGQTLTMEIQPMVKGPCLVYAPNEECWQKYAPAWARNKRKDIIDYLSSVKWNRNIEFEDVDINFTSETPVPGSLESTAGGREFESKLLFHPNASVTADQAKELWYVLCRRCAAAAQGKVNIFRGSIVPGSVFEEIELPTLEKNTNVEIIFH